MSTSHLARTLAVDVVSSLRSIVLPEAREVGDVRRNAAVFLARKAGGRASSFERNLQPTVDHARLTEVPYLAAVGYLIAAGLLENTPMVQLKRGIATVTRRAAHTAERTGYADDALCSCGLLLLARTLQEDTLAAQLHDTLIQVSYSDASMAAVVAVTLGNPVRTMLELPEGAPDRLAAALLVHRFNQSIARKSFPGLPADLEGQLVLSVTSSTFTPSADFGAMVILGALEASIALPDDALPPVVGRCDVAVIVALKEEFRVLFERFKNRHTHVEDGGCSYYVFDVPGLTANRPFRCVATLVGEMGTNRTGVIVEKALGRWDPSTVVLVGIAGGIHDDIKLGDVIVASEVENYFEGAKATDAAGKTEFRRAGDSFKTNHALLERVRNFEFTSRAAYQRWERICSERRKALGSDADALVREGLLRALPAQKEGHIASGPLVVTSKEFTSWIRAGDRSCMGIEMEAGGLMIAAHMDTGHRDALVVRGISDFGDERKAKLDATGGGALRRYAMENATDFVWALIENGVIGRKSGFDEGR